MTATGAQPALRVTIGEDDVLLREGIARILSGAGLDVVAQAGDADELLRGTLACRPDVAIVDVQMPPRREDDGLLAAVELRSQLPQLGLLILSQYCEPEFARQLIGDRPEGVGYLLKERVGDVTTFTDAIARVASGGTALDAEVVRRMLGRRPPGDPLNRLTHREHAVLAVMAEGRSNLGIAQTLLISQAAVEKYVTAIFRKLAIAPANTEHRRVQAVLMFLHQRELDAALAAEFRLAAAVSVPISVAGEVWGMFTATADSGPLPAGVEHRLLQFTGLVTAALANIQSRSELQALADEQAALRSVAELAAQDAPAEEVLGAVARHASRLAGVDFSTLLRFEPDGSTEIVALDGAPAGITLGMRAPGTGDGAVQRVWRTGEPARINNLADMSGRWPQVAHGHGFSTSAAVPVLGHGTLWGVLVVVGRDEPLPAEIHAQLTSFAELAGTAISATQDRLQVQQLAEEQGALRRVAELVARGAALPEVFTAVAVETSHLLGNLAAVLLRYGPDEAALTVAVGNSSVPLGLRFPAAPGTATGEVLRTGRPFRVDNFTGTDRADPAAEFGATSSVAVPITVEGRVWGSLSGASSGPPLPLGTEDRLTPFAELAAAAIANAENKQKLTASRARVVATADETRRRLQRDVHDSAQQRLVHTIITLKLARDAIAAGHSGADFVEEALINAQRANSDLRDVVRGILPAALTRGGLRTGLEALAADFSLPITLHASVPRLPAGPETTAYFIVAEALTNVIKHAHATQASVTISLKDDHLDIQIEDDGTGGANPDHGSGLTGLQDRVEASNGTLVITSPPGNGTNLHATLPVGLPPESFTL